MRSVAPVIVVQSLCYAFLAVGLVMASPAQTIPVARYAGTPDKLVPGLPFDVVRDDGTKPLRIDIEEFVKAQPDTSGCDYTIRAGTLTNHNEVASSPDGHYIGFPVLLSGLGMQGESLHVVLIDTVTGQSEFRKVYSTLEPWWHGKERPFIFGPFSPSVSDGFWIGPTRFAIAIGDHRDYDALFYIYDVKRDKSTLVADRPARGTLASDGSGDNICYLTQSTHPAALAGQPIRTNIDDPQLERTYWLRYNGFWLYPAPRLGYTEPAGYAAYLDNPRNFPSLSEIEAGLETHTVMSSPAFVGKTSWVAFFEQIYELGVPNHVVGTNLVLLDASAVHENPPDPAHIRILKKPLPHTSIHRAPIRDTLTVRRDLPPIPSTDPRIYETDNYSQRKYTRDGFKREYVNMSPTEYNYWYLGEALVTRYDDETQSVVVYQIDKQNMEEVVWTPRAKTPQDFERPEGWQRYQKTVHEICRIPIDLDRLAQGEAPFLDAGAILPPDQPNASDEDTTATADSTR